MGDEQKQSGSFSGYGLRDKQRPDYKAMHFGDSKADLEEKFPYQNSVISPIKIHKKSEDETLQGAVGGRSSDDDFDIVRPYGDIDRQMKQAENELSQLQEEEEMLRKSLELQKMKQQFTEKKGAVKKLRGKNIFTAKEKTPRVPKTHKTVSSAIDSENEIILSLRKDNKLKNLVQKELKSWV